MKLPHSLTELIEDRAARAADRLALAFEDGQLSYGELACRVRRAATVLRDNGIGAGDRVGLMVGNALDVPVALFAAARIGAMIVPLHVQHRGEVLRHMATHADPRLLIMDPGLVDAEQRATLRAAAPAAVVIEAPAGRSAFMAATAAATEDARSPAVGGPVSIMYTSGTTGRSKGVVLDQRFYLVEGDAYRQIVEPGPDDVFGSVLPMAHANAQIASLIGAMVSAVPLVCWRRFSAGAFWSDLTSAGVTVVNLLGAMAPILLKRHPEPARDHTVRLTVGGAIPVAAASEFRRRFGVDTREVFGLTEVGIACGERDGSRRLGTTGRPLDRWDFRIAADEGAGDREGEIQIRAREPSAMFREYWRDPERTRAAFTDDGWFRTGDRGRIDEEGFLVFSGRIKDSIRRRGENISADEVEAIVNRHPGVAESAVLAVPSELAEDEVKLVYVPRPGVATTPSDLYAFCEREMAPFMVPRYIERRASLPKTPTLKVRRSELTSTEPPVVDTESEGFRTDLSQR